MIPTKDDVVNFVSDWNDRRRRNKERKKKEKEIYNKQYDKVYSKEREKYLVKKAEIDAKNSAHDKPREKSGKKNPAIDWLKKESKNWGVPDGERSIGESLLSAFSDDGRVTKKQEKSDDIRIWEN